MRRTPLLIGRALMTDEFEEICPGCGDSVMGGRIPERMVHNYVPLKHYHNPQEWLKDNPWPRWRNKLGIEVRGAYDGVLIWKHETCGHMWPRFSESDWDVMYHRALIHIDIMREAEGQERDGCEA